MTESGTYRLTPSAKKLYIVLIDPENVGKSVTEVCRIAGVSRETYYRLYRDERFVELVKDTSINLVKDKIGDVVNATYKYALGEKGHQDRKMLLTMSGLYAEKSETKVEGVIDIGSVSDTLQRYLLDDTADEEADVDVG